MNMIYGYMLTNNKDSQILTENKVCNSDGFLITIDFDATETNFDKDPYVKVYPSESFSSATEVARIHFLYSLRFEKEHKGNKKSITSFSNKDLKTICGLIKSNWLKLLNLYIKGCNIPKDKQAAILAMPYPEGLYNAIKS